MHGRDAALAAPATEGVDCSCWLDFFVYDPTTAKQTRSNKKNSSNVAPTPKIPAEPCQLLVVESCNQNRITIDIAKSPFLRVDFYREIDPIVIVVQAVKSAAFRKFLGASHFQGIEPFPVPS